MSVRVTLGEPLWRELGTAELTIDLDPDGSLVLAELPARVGLKGWAAEGLMAVVNDRLVPAREAATLTLHDGDHVVLQLLLAGG